jgi:hypothetical protein
LFLLISFSVSIEVGAYSLGMTSRAHSVGFSLNGSLNPKPVEFCVCVWLPAQSIAAEQVDENHRTTEQNHIIFSFFSFSPNFDDVVVVIVSIETRRVFPVHPKKKRHETT